jgi:ribosome biogenesis GTPase
MNLEDLGFISLKERTGFDLISGSLQIGRVIAEHKERYAVRTILNELDAEITGNMRFTAVGREDFPAVGDWVALTVYESDFGIIHKILPRFSVIKRQSVGHSGEVQIIATNIDFGFIVQAVDRDFNINRLERYLTICNESDVKPLIILTKTDLISSDKLNDIIGSISSRIINIPVFAISNYSKEGYNSLKEYIQKGKTYCMLGSSGVGKSTLLNNLTGKDIMRTDTISVSTNKGRHVTSHRELFVLESGGILIDNPGMREVGIADASGGLETTFDEIMSYGRKCRYKDCTHTNESDCAVIAAVEEGIINRSSYENYMKMEREKAHFLSTIAERRKKDKDFGKIMKNYKKGLKKQKE